MVLFAPCRDGKFERNWFKPQMTRSTASALPRVAEGSDTREHLAFQKLHGGTTTRAAVRYLFHCFVLLASSCGVTTTDDGDGAVLGCTNDCVHEGFSASLEFPHFKYTHRAIPNNSFRCVDSSFVQRIGFWPAVQTQIAIRDTLFLSDGLHIAVFTELRRYGEIHWKNDFDSFLLRFCHDVWHNLSTFFVIKRRTDRHAVVYFQEGKRHATTDDQLVDLVQHIEDELNLIRNLCTTKDGQHWLGRGVQNLSKSIKFLRHQATSGLDFESLSDHRTVCTMRGAKCIIDVHVGQLPDRGAEFSDLG